MKQKLQSFKKEIRRQQINNYFVMRRQQQDTSSSNRQIVFAIEEEKKNRKAVMPKNEVEIEIQQTVYTQKFQSKCSSYLTDLKQFWEMRQYNEFIMLLKQISKELKRIRKLQEIGQQCQDMTNTFLRSNILVVAVDSLIKATSENINPGILRELSKISLSILSSSIELAPSMFSQNLFENSNIIPFLRCAITQPLTDSNHLQKLIPIVTHMIIESVNSTGRLFNLLNCKNSKFHISCILFSVSRMQLRPGLTLTQNFIILMKHYFYKIEHDHVNNLKYDPKALPNTCLEKNQIDIVCEIVNASINEFDINMYDNQGAQSLTQTLEVCRILMEYFRMSKNYKFKLNYKKLIELLSYKETRMEIKSSILAILDHLIYEDQGDLTQFLVKEGELVHYLWMIRSDFYAYTMNIFCNLALNTSTKPFLNPYAHNIFTGLKYNRGDKMVWNFVYNWFSSQKFEIIESRDKLVVELIKDSQESNQQIRQLQCMFWYNLIRHNQYITVPCRILEFDNQVAAKIKELIQKNSEYSL